MRGRVIALIVRRRCDQCGQRADARVLYGGQQWCAQCAIADARQLGAVEALEGVAHAR